LECASIKFLCPICDRNSEQIAARAYAHEAAETFEPRMFCSQMEVETHGCGIVIDRGCVHLQCAHIFAPVLRADVCDLRARTGDQIVHTAGEARQLWIQRTKRFDHGNFREFVSDKKQMRKNRSVRAMQPMENLDR